MLIAQLAAFLTIHHHPQWVAELFTGTLAQLEHVYQWAMRHGFRYQP